LRTWWRNARIALCIIKKYSKTLYISKKVCYTK
jgi:hypothetical protein